MGASFGARLRALRKFHGITQAALSNYLSLPDGSYTVSRSTIASIEADHDVPSLELVVRVSCVFQLSVDYLLRDLDLAGVDHTYPRSQRLGIKMQQLRKTRRLTQKATAEALGLQSRAYLSNIENAGRYPSIELLIRIADYFGVSIDALIDDTCELPLPLSTTTSSSS